MKYQCHEGHIFLFPKTNHTTLSENNWTEHKSCPFPKCSSLDLREVEEPQAKIESMIQVTYEEVNGFLKEGYEVKDTYATKVTMVKKAKEEKL